MSTRIKIGAITFQCPEQPQNPVSTYRGTREWRLYAAGTATETTIRNAVVRGLITAEQYTEITGEPYVA